MIQLESYEMFTKQDDLSRVHAKEMQADLSCATP